jgi:hypothetical protein
MCRVANGRCEQTTTACRTAGRCAELRLRAPLRRTLLCRSPKTVAPIHHDWALCLDLSTENRGQEQNTEQTMKKA